MTSITILKAHKEKGHGAKFVCPISNLAGSLAAILFVDDTDILHVDLDTNQSVEEAHTVFQESIYNWGQLILVTGGAFKPPKCVYYVLSFEWQNSGAWRYAKNELRDDLDIAVPMPDGSMVDIKHLAVTESRETLRVELCPSGSAKDFIKSMQTKAQKWIDRANEGSKLRRRDIWFPMDHQLYPKTGYGLCSVSAPLKELV